MRKRAWRRGRVLESKSGNLGSRPGDVAFETIQFYRRSSTFVKVCRNSSIFIVKFSSGMSEILFNTCVFWSCVTRCGCRTTSSTLFTVCWSSMPHTFLSRRHNKQRRHVAMFDYSTISNPVGSNTHSVLFLAVLRIWIRDPVPF